MGQFALGIRSLLIKAAVFVVLAALLAWALGGTLFPRPSRAEIYAISVAGQDWYWRISVYGKRTLDSEKPEDRIQWELLWKERQTGDLKALEDAVWYEVSGPIVSDGALYFAGRPSGTSESNREWVIARVDETRRIAERWAMPDRLAVEQQLSRLKAGFALQDVATIRAQRELMLDPPSKNVDGTNSQ